MIIGFSGTREGMTLFQRQQVEHFLRTERPDSVVHGGCIGADDQFDLIASLLGFPRAVFPSTKIDASVSAHTLRSRAGSPVTIHAARPPLDRNRDIVRASSMMIIAPKTDEEVLRSGTWATKRYAERVKCPFRVFGTKAYRP